MESPEADHQASLRLRGQAEIWRHMFAFVDSLALKCAIELQIPDIIHSHGAGRPITLSQIISCIDNAPSPDISYLERIMRKYFYNIIILVPNRLVIKSKRL